MNLRCHLTFLGRIERNKNSSGKRASSSASQINLSFILTQATTLLNPPLLHSLTQTNQAKQTNQKYKRHYANPFAEENRTRITVSIQIMH